MKNSFSSAQDVIKAFKANHYTAYSRNCYNTDYGFEGLPTCYSYGSHYPLIIKDRLPDGAPIYLINIAGYSNTTAKHIGYALRRFSENKTIQIERWFYANNAYDQVIRRCMSYWKDSKKCRKEHNKMYKESEAYNLYFRYAQFTARHVKFIEKMDYAKIENLFNSLLIKEAKEAKKRQKDQAIAYAQSLQAKKQLAKSKRIIGKLEQFFIRIGINKCNTGGKVNVLGVKLEQTILPDHVFFIHYGYTVEGDHVDKARLCLTEQSTGLMVRDSEAESFQKFINESLILIENKKQFIIDQVESFLSKQTEGKV